VSAILSSARQKRERRKKGQGGQEGIVVSLYRAVANAWAEERKEREEREGHSGAYYINSSITPGGEKGRASLALAPYSYTIMPSPSSVPDRGRGGGKRSQEDGGPKFFSSLSYAVVR